MSVDRFNDLNRQGFMRRVYEKPRKSKEPSPIVACDACLNWHRKGKHTATAAERKANLASRRG